MKNFIYLTTVLLMLLPSTILGNNTKDEEKIEIDLNVGNLEKENEKENERSIINPSINAFLYPNSKDVEVELFNIGDATITILNQWGQVIASDFTTTDIPAIINLNLSSQKGTFCLIVSSSQAFAQGWFVL